MNDVQLDLDGFEESIKLENTCNHCDCKCGNENLCEYCKAQQELYERRYFERLIGW